MKPDESTLSSSNLKLFPCSLVEQDGMEFALAQTSSGLQLTVVADPARQSGFDGKCFELAGKTLLIGPLTSKNIATLRTHLDWLNPRLLGTHTSVGMGDRIGLATPGHIRAIRKTEGKIAPIFAQQSMREMTRTRRTPQQVMDEAAWGVFQEGWQNGFGADADHLKIPEDIDACLAAGYTFFTIDPGAYVDNRAEYASVGELRELSNRLSANLQPRASGLLEKTFDFEGLPVTFSEAVLLKTVVKYGRAIAHVASMFNHLVNAAGGQPFEVEVSVDETDQPTSHAEHLYIAKELKRLGVKWGSLAPRFVGKFEKGVDYIGNLADFETCIAGHAAIARQLGPYKLSLHSGSDKFSIYPAAMRQTRGLVHLKTAGTSYLEALRTISTLDSDLFREIYIFARQQYETDKTSYHVSAKLSRAPDPGDVKNWPALLDQFDAREILHVTFGSVLTDKMTSGHWHFRERFMELLRSHPEAYASALEKHFDRHLTPFTLD